MLVNTFAFLVILQNVASYLPGITVFQEQARLYSLYNVVISLVFILFYFLSYKNRSKKLTFILLVLPIITFTFLNIKKSFSSGFEENQSLTDFILNSTIRIEERENQAEVVSETQKKERLAKSELIFDYSKNSSFLNNNLLLKKSFSNEINCNFEKLKIYSREESFDRDSSYGEELIPVNIEDITTSGGGKVKVVCFKLLPLNSRYNLFKNRVVIRRVGTLARFRQSPMIVAFEYEGTVFNFHYRMFRWVSRMNLLDKLSEKGSVGGLVGGKKIYVWG